MHKSAWRGVNIAAGVLLLAKALPDGDGARVPLAVGGVIGVLAGPSGIFYGFGHLNPENHGVSLSVAQEALDRSVRTGQ